MTRRSARNWKIAAGVLGGAIGVSLGYLAGTFLYVGTRTIANPAFDLSRAGETAFAAVAGALLIGSLGAFVGVLAARVATGK